MNYYGNLVYMYTKTISILTILAEVLMFATTGVYIAVMFLGVKIPSHVYHELHLGLQLLLALGLILTSMYSCKSAGCNDNAARTRCAVSSKFGLVMGIIVLASTITGIGASSLDTTGDGLISYDDFSNLMSSFGSNTFSNKFESNLFDLMGGDVHERIRSRDLEAALYPLA